MAHGRYATLLLCMLAALALALGCARAPVTDEPPRQLGSGEPEPVSQVGQGGTARVVLPLFAAPECLNPYLSACEGSEYLSGVVFEGLLLKGPNGDYRPLLAGGMPSYDAGTLSLEPMSVEVTLRDGASFSDGEPVRSRDVVWTYEQAMRVAEAGGISPEYSGFARLESVEAVGERTVRLTFDGPYSRWRELLTAPVLPEHVYGGGEDLSTLPLTDDPVGSGPFLLGEFRGAGGSSFTANPRYWTEELEQPRLDGLEVEYAGPVGAERGLGGGEADFGVFGGSGMPESGDVVRAGALRERTELLVFNAGALDESERAALSANVNREAVAEEAGFEPAGSVFSAVDVSETSPPWREISPSPEPGSLSGVSLRLVYPAGGPARDRAAGSVAAGLREAGASVAVERVAGGEFYSETLPGGDFDLALLDLGDPAEYEALAGALPESSAGAISTSLGRPEDEERYLTRTQEILAGEYALAPLYRWPDSYAWSSTLSGPTGETPPDAFAWNIREWGFYK
ncbi:Bacterial extracellular solute-binding protein, family 5 Middle [Rubrobacter radiotolerans]|uniref:ABC transporter substrate-binding protein n=1 Tax=Rubrobacter radiotolerans TaxID=42256 RepID=A0A023X0U2_RUBRA|nr:ABC transporter substrate-binding protein [Rubrobacter radiotolerans]AHY46057.1 Bacterial extracellular solute-binding protein, family 5 Middle [Rubrobacter radiotolerans]MDX5893467.1 ABC transporter substrate-binding protein [Rubrobacter radiotolerans]SMC03785.1 peptide/nickel transport system substrate-binding protein [Rubrobacter radiotolerans DSM 5868]